MGYTHYWYRPKEIPREIFKEIVDDFRKLLPAFEMLDIPLANGIGEGEPVINYKAVIFNGKRNCGHKKLEITIPWPDDDIIPLFSAPDPDKAISGSWFGGDLLRQRVCNGDCSYETFFFPRVDTESMLIGEIIYYKQDGTPVYNPKNIVGKYFNCCKTAFRPYDLAVIFFLVIAKHYLGDDIIVKTDGEHQHWADAFLLCQDQFGYGAEYTIKDGELIKSSKSTLVVFLTER